MGRKGGMAPGVSKDPISRQRLRRTVGFDTEVYERLEQEAKERGVSIAWLLHVVLRKYFNMPPSVGG